MLKFIPRDSEDKKTKLVVFIHGFTGGEETWVNENKKSFPELLLEDEELKNNYDFAYFTYYSKLVSPPVVGILKKIFNKHSTIKKNVDIQMLSQMLATEIRNKCTEYPEIFLVAHSMGGLVAKAYILAEELNRTSKVRAFISLAVPHNGSNAALLGAGLKNPQVNNLMPLDSSIMRLNQDWIKREEDNTVYIIGGYDDVVPRNSGVPLGVEVFEVCQDDHISISKPIDMNSTNYMIVANNLKELVVKKNRIIVQPYTDEGEFDEQVFVVKLLSARVPKVIINSAKQSYFNAELMVRELSNTQRMQLSELYVKIKNLYCIYFAKLASGHINDSNELVGILHEKIREDEKLTVQSQEFRSMMQYINEIHKTGMLHQLANIDEDVIWEK